MSSLEGHLLQPEEKKYTWMEGQTDKGTQFYPNFCWFFSQWTMVTQSSYHQKYVLCIDQSHEYIIGQCLVVLWYDITFTWRVYIRFVKIIILCFYIWDFITDSKKLIYAQIRFMQKLLGQTKCADDISHNSNNIKWYWAKGNSLTWIMWILGVSGDLNILPGNQHWLLITKLGQPIWDNWIRLPYIFLQLNWWNFCF